MRPVIQVIIILLAFGSESIYLVNKLIKYNLVMVALIRRRIPNKFSNYVGRLFYQYTKRRNVNL